MSIGAIGSFTGGIDPAHLQKLRQQLFEKIDASGDGQITQTEMEAYGTTQGISTKQSDGLFQALGGIQSLVAQAQPAAAPPPPPSLSDLFNQLDTDQNGQLTKAELEQAFTSQGGTTEEADSLFSQLDPNGTGSVTQAQFESGMKQVM